MQAQSETIRSVPAPVVAPKVAVIVTNFNYGRYVGWAIDSIAAQTYRNFECIIIDDRSTDGSFEMIAGRVSAMNDERFRCVLHDRNLGQMAAFKTGLAQTTSQFVCFVDADDMLFPDYLLEQLSAHLNPSFSASISCCDTIQIDETNHMIEGTFYTLVKTRSDRIAEYGGVKAVHASARTSISDSSIVTLHDTSSHPPLHYVERHTAGWHGVATTAFMFRRDLLDMIIPDDAGRLRKCADTYLVAFAHLLTGTLTIGRALSCFRRHRQNAFSHSPRLGGPSHINDLTEQPSVKPMIAEHVAKNIDLFLLVMDWSYCKSIIARMVPRRRIYALAKDNPRLRHLYGRGSDLRFRLKYQLWYRLAGSR